MSWIDFLGYMAALTVLATFCMDTIVPLRGLAIASNVLFILYGIAGHLYPVFFLHAVLLPVNIVKIVQLRLQVRRANGKQIRTDRQRSAQ
jgi:membrane glycosyltransferase